MRNVTVDVDRHVAEHVLRHISFGLPRQPALEESIRRLGRVSAAVQCVGMERGQKEGDVQPIHVPRVQN